MYKREDGIVDFDKSICIGCKACMAACPYDAIFINPADNSAEKCNFCAHRIDMGLEPACVVVCPTQAILVGDMNDADSYLSQIINRSPVNVRRPEKETLPKLFYKGAHQATLDPIAARRPEGGLFMWSEQLADEDKVISGNPDYSNTSAAALLSYDVAHSLPWGWRVSLYTWTKGIAAGAYLVPLLLVLFGFLPVDSPLWRWVAPVLAGAFLGFTGLLLILDLKHPERFYLIFTKHQWKSWLVKGAFIIAAYSAVLAAHFLSSIIGSPKLQGWLMLAGLPLAAMTAIYTAFLFAQAKARDLWQSPLLPPHLLVQALLVGSASLLPFTFFFNTKIEPLLWLLGATGITHVLMVWGEVSLTHTTAHARLAAWEMTRGRFKMFFVLGMILSMIGCLAPFIDFFAVPFALIGLLLYEHAYVQAGQSVPLA
jgi:ferredoxin/formate-dependent nitrite reductase membrane component NrfD